MDRKRLESVGTEYAHLRGLFAIPFGLLMIAAGLGNLGWGPFDPAWGFLVVVAVAGLLCLAIVRHYNRNYGRISLPRSVQVRGAVTAVACIPLVVGAAMVDNNLDLPVWAFGVGWALLMLISYGSSVGLKLHHLVIWGAVLAASLLPVWGRLGPDMRANAGLMAAGVAVMVSGAFDHQLLVRAFGSLPGAALSNRGIDA